jgi:hypothetical protein
VGGTLNAPGSFAAVHVKVMLQRVADLTVVSQQDLIETTAQELRGYPGRVVFGPEDVTMKVKASGVMTPELGRRAQFIR